MATHRRHDGSVEAELSSLFERRLGGLMLVRLELTDVLEKFKREEHALATSLRGILQLRDQERTSFEARLSRSQAYAKKLEYELSSRGLPLPAAPTSPFVPEVRAPNGFGGAAAAEPPAAYGHQRSAVSELPASPRGHTAGGQVAGRGGGGVLHDGLWAAESLCSRADTLSIQALSSSFLAAGPAASAAAAAAPPSPLYGSVYAWGGGGGGGEPRAALVAAEALQAEGLRAEEEERQWSERREAGERWRRIEEERAEQLKESRLAQRLARERAALATPQSAGYPHPHGQSPSTPPAAAAAAAAASTVRLDELTGATVYATADAGSARDGSERNGGDRGGGGGGGGANGLEVVPPPYLEKNSTATSLALSQMSDGYDEVRIGQCACPPALCSLSALYWHTAHRIPHPALLTPQLSPSPSAPSIPPHLPPRQVRVPTFVLGLSPKPRGLSQTARVSGSARGSTDSPIVGGGHMGGPVFPLLDGPVPAAIDSPGFCGRASRTLPTGNVRTPGESPTHTRRPSNPEVVTAEGCSFSFQHG